MAASEAVLTKLRERIVAFAASRIGMAAAEAMAQETLMLLHEKYRDVEAVEELVPLSFRIVRFKMAAGFRKSAPSWRRNGGAGGRMPACARATIRNTS